MSSLSLSGFAATFCILCLIVTSLPSLFSRIKPSNSSRRLSNLPAGPKSLPLVGNVFHFWSLRANPISTLAQLTCFGELTTLWLGSSPVLLVNSPKVADDLLQKRAAFTSSRPVHNLFRQEALPNRLVLASSGAEFRNLRTIYHDLLQPGRNVDFRKHQEDESVHFLVALRERPRSFLHECERFAINVIHRPMYGVRLGQKSDTQIREMYEIWRTMYLYFLPGTLPLDFAPFLLRMWSCLQPWQWLVARLKKQEAQLHIDQLQRLDKTMNECDVPDTLASILLRGCAPEKPRRSTRDLLTRTKTIDLLAMLLGAGSDTTSALLQTFFKVMAMFPEAMLFAQQELDANIGTDRLPNWRDVERLPYCQALISELHRWSPIANVGIPHATTASIEYGGYLIPKNTILIPNLPSLHRSPEWFQEPQMFDPKRFLATTKRTNDSQKIKGHYHYGFGRRSCPGEHIAEDSLFIVITRVLWAFDIRTPADSQLRMEDQRDGLLRKPKPFHVHVRLRDPSRSRVLDDQYAQALAASDCVPSPNVRT